jgi:hypothetical protein
LPYPLVKDLPPVVETRKWEWRPYCTVEAVRGEFFAGTDELGVLWLTKMRGSFRGYREIVFERLVQRAGWLCQSSTFAILESNSLPRRTVRNSERIQIVTRLLSEHGPSNCKPGCPIAPLRGRLDHRSDDPLDLLAASSLADPWNIARAQILAPLLGGTEPAGWLTTVDHQVFLIDGELMFAENPSDVRQTGWWMRSDGSPSLAGQRLTCDICATIGSLGNDDLEHFLDKPAGLKIRVQWPIRPLLYRARDYARAFSRHAICLRLPPSRNGT